MKATKTKSIRTYEVTPINDIQSSFAHFDWHWSVLDGMRFVTPSATEDAAKIELIRCKPGTTEETLREIGERGYAAAPSPYLLGLGVQHRAVIEECGLIVSLDERNLLLYDGGDPCFLSLDWDGERDLVLA